MKKYFSMETTDSEANIHIYGDITEWEWLESDVSSYTLAKQLQELNDVETIHVHINSYGGEVKEGLAIYNALKQHKAKVITYCDGFACSIASVIFMAGDERVMSNSSLLMIHNAWTYCSGNANDLRKTADDLETMTKMSVNAYLKEININEEELIQLLDAETWLTGAQALEMGFITSIVGETESKVSQSVKKSLVEVILEHQKEKQSVKKPEEPPAKEDDAAQTWSSFFNAIK